MSKDPVDADFDRWDREQEKLRRRESLDERARNEILERIAANDPIELLRYSGERERAMLAEIARVAISGESSDSLIARVLRWGDQLRESLDRDDVEAQIDRIIEREKDASFTEPE